MALYDGWGNVANSARATGNYLNSLYNKAYKGLGDALVGDLETYGGQLWDWNQDRIRGNKLLEAYKNRYYDEVEGEDGEKSLEAKKGPSLSDFEGGRYAAYADDPTMLQLMDAYNTSAATLEEVEAAKEGLSRKEFLEYIQSLQGQDNERRNSAEKSMAERASALGEKIRTEKEQREYQAAQQSYQTLSNEINSLIATSKDSRNSISARIAAKNELAQARDRMAMFCAEHPEFSYPMESVDKALGKGVASSEGASKTIAEGEKPILNDYFNQLVNSYMPKSDDSQEDSAEEGEDKVTKSSENRAAMKYQEDKLLKAGEKRSPLSSEEEESIKAHQVSIEEQTSSQNAFKPKKAMRTLEDKEAYFANDTQVWDDLNEFIKEGTTAESVNQWLTYAWEAGAIDRLKGDPDFMTKFSAWYNEVGGSMLDLSRYTAINHILGGRQPETAEQANERVDKAKTPTKSNNNESDNEVKAQNNFISTIYCMYNGVKQPESTITGKELKQRLRNIPTSKESRSLEKFILRTLGVDTVGELKDETKYRLGG